jgi:hypothetical protein
MESVYKCYITENKEDVKHYFNKRLCYDSELKADLDKLTNQISSI